MTRQTLGSYLGRILGVYDQTSELPTMRQHLILFTLHCAKEPIPGLEILRRLQIANGGVELMNLGNLYSDLKRLRKKGWVELNQGEPVGGGCYRGNYAITEAGNDTVLRVITLLHSS